MINLYRYGNRLTENKKKLKWIWYDKQIIIIIIKHTVLNNDEI